MVCTVSVKFCFQTSWNSGGFLCPVHGYAKFMYTGKGGDGVDADGIPLSNKSSMAERADFWP